MIPEGVETVESSGVTFMYEDIFKLEAVCRDVSGERRFPLIAKPPRMHLCWEPSPGVIMESQVPVQLAVRSKPAAAMKRPASCKRPASSKSKSKRPKKMREEAKEEEEEKNEWEDDNEQENDPEEEDNEQDEDEEEAEREEEEEENEPEECDNEEGEECDNEQEEDDNEEEEEDNEGGEECDNEGGEEDDNEGGEENDNEGGEEDDNEGEKAEAGDNGRKEKKAEAKQAPKRRVVSKRPASMVESGLVEGLCFREAYTGKHIRCYILVRVAGKQTQLVQVSLKESLDYKNLVSQLLEEASLKVKNGITFVNLRVWAAMKKSMLLGLPDWDKLSPYTPQKSPRTLNNFLFVNGLMIISLDPILEASWGRKHVAISVSWCPLLGGKLELDG